MCIRDSILVINKPFLILLECNRDTCKGSEHRECVESSFGRPAMCLCRRGLVEVEGVCTTRPICYSVRLKFTLPFLDHLLDLWDTLTINFIAELQGRLFIALRLVSGEFVYVVRFYSGSTITEVDILLPSNTNQNETTITNNLWADISRNETTQELFRYYPTALSAVTSAVLQINSNLI